jgi:hypothetical protein
VGEAVLAERHHLRLAWWAAFSEYLTAKSSTFRIRRANKNHYFNFSIGRSGFNIASTVSFEKRQIGVELYIENDPEKIAYRALLAQCSDIEREFGETLDWQELPGKKASRIAIYRLNCDPADESDRENQQAWMLDKMNRFKAVFMPRIKALPLGNPVNDDNAEIEGSSGEL